MRRNAAAVVCGPVAVCAAVVTALGAGARGAPVVLTAPVAGAVVAAADPPDDPYAPGRRAAVIASVPPGAPVLAAADGTVRWRGQVAGRRYVVVDHGDGVVTTVGALRGPLPDVGTAVRRGTPVGAHDPVAGPSGVTFSLRRDGRHVDPAPSLTGVRAQLVPSSPGCRPVPRC